MKQLLFTPKRFILTIFICIMPIAIMAQKVSLDTLTIDEVNLYMDKAVKMENTGMILTSAGVGIVAASFIVGVLIGEAPPDQQDGTLNDYAASLYVIAIGGMVGIAASCAGIPMWLTGRSRQAKAELTLQKLNIAHENSVAVGLGITIRF